jgi:hypothetical protein
VPRESPSLARPPSGSEKNNALAYREISALKDRLNEEKLYLEDEVSSHHEFRDIVGRLFDDLASFFSFVSIPDDYYDHATASFLRSHDAEASG